jgi:hypothetical protein
MKRALVSTVLSLLFVTTPSFAQEKQERQEKHQPSAGDLATARTALREGLLLRDKGEHAEALARLASAYDLVATPVTGFELGKTHLMLGHVLQAHELFKKVQRMPPSMEESTRSQTSRDEAARLAKEIEPRIPSLRIKLQLPPGATATVRVDEDRIATPAAETLRAVDPGPHDIIAKAGDGPEQKVHVEVAESEIKDVALSPQWIPPKNPPPKDSGAPAIFVRSTNPLVFIGFGVAAASALTGVITGYFALKERADARDQCGRNYCPPRAGDAATLNTDQDFTDTANAAAALTLVSIVAGISTVVFAGVGFVGLRKPVKERVVSRIEPMFGTKSLGLVGTF